MLNPLICNFFKLRVLYVLSTLLVSLCYSSQVKAQSTFQQHKLISPEPDSIYFLDGWVVPGSIQLEQNDTLLPQELWEFTYETGYLSLTDNYWKEYRIGAELTIRYSVYALDISRSYQLREALEIDSALFTNPELKSASLSRNSESQVRQSGSLSRGIIVGSNQDFALESGLNFQLSGQLTEDIRINASLTDQSIPIQPDGTTQNLREFDKVFIELEAPNAQLEMGDVDISYDQSSFARLNRRLQGASGSYLSSNGEYSGAASVVRGTYKSLQVDAQEGVQGPYRLTGRNEQDFVIILAGTERVYVNGQQVQRGAENAYIIDYGLGELTFTNNLLVKDETRITIEYEYVDQDFNRTLIAAEGGDEFYDGKLSIGATVIRQADGDDLLSQQTLTRNDIDLLREAGDDLDGALVSGARVATEEERQQYVMYAQADTLYNGNLYTIYRHEPGSPESIYRVQFSKVTEGEGAYRRTSGQVNGLLYEWVGPGNGNYTPFRQLPAPQKQQMVALKSRYKLSDRVELFGEWAASDFDANRFSELDDADNTDMAYETGLRINGASTRMGALDAQISRRYSGRNFQFFERTRDVEFDRKWNITRTGQSEEAINEASLTIRPSDNTSLGGDFGLVERQNFRGLRQASNWNSSEEGAVALSYSQDWIQSEDEVLQLEGNWFRQQGVVSKLFGEGNFTLSPYFAFEQENRSQKNALTDSLSVLSQRFIDAGPGMTLTLGSLVLDAGFAYRKEQGVLRNELADEAQALEQHYKMAYRPSALFSTQNELRIRNKNYTDAFTALGNRDRKGLLIKSVTNYASSGGFIDGEVYYEANTRRQALLQESYIEVGPEIGQYVWDDQNRDGVQQVDEFFPEVSVNEGTFIRQYLPSDELLPVIDLNVRLLHEFRPMTLFGEDSWMSEITLRSRVDIRENSTTARLEDIYLLNLSEFRNDSTTLRGLLLWEKELDLFRGIERADLKLGYTENRGLNRRSTESIEQFTNRGYLNTSYEITPMILLTLDTQFGLNRSISDRYTNRNFDIQSLDLKPGINGTINRSWNAGFQVSYALKQDRYPGIPVKAEVLKLSTTHRTYLWRKLQSNLRLELRNTRIDGRSSTYGSYELTEGTGEGTNLIWSLNNTYRASDLIRFTFIYDGRTVSDRPSVHIVKVVMSATF